MCEDKDHIIVGDRIEFSTRILKTLTERRVVLKVEEIKVKDNGTKEVWVSNLSPMKKR